MGLDTWIIPSKIAAPAPPAGALAREGPGPGGLAPVTLLQAGPGGGKTTAMAALAAAHGGALAWVTLDDGDADPATCFAYLVAAVRAHIPAFGDDVRAMAAQGAPPKAVWGRFFQALAAYDPPALVLALDDAHHLVGTPDTAAGLTYWFDKLPPGVRLLVATRSRWPGALGRLAAAGRVQVLDEARLRFSPAEVDAYLRAAVPALAEEPAFRERARGLEGWPLGLAMLVADPGRTLAPDAAQGGDRELAAYVAEELYERRAPHERAFMLRAAVLEEPTAEACREVLQLDDAAATLAALEADHLVARRGEVYAFPGHLRAFLRAEAERAVPAEERRGWHRWAAEHYRAQARPELAIPHLIACGDWRAAGAACAEAFPRMRHDGRQALIARWLDAFPDEAFAQDPRLLVWHGTALARGGRLPEGLAAYDRALAAFAARGDRPGQFKVRVAQANITLARQEAAAYAECLLAAQGLAADGEPEDVADLALIRGHAAEQKGDLEGFRGFNEQALATRDDGGLELAATRYIAHVNLYTYHLHRGAYREAHGHLERAIALAEERAFYPYALAARIQRAHLWLVEGRADEADAAMRALPEGWRDVLDWHDMACAHAVTGHLHLARGEWREAEERLRASMALFDRIGLLEGKKIPLELLLWLAVRRRQPQRVPTLIAEAAVPAGKTIYDLVLLLPRARAALQADDAAGALALAREAAAALEPLGAQRHLAHARAIEAAARMRLGERAEARDALGKAEAAIAARGYACLRQLDPDLFTELAGLGGSGPLPASPGGLVATVAAAEPARSDLGLSLTLLGGFEARVDGRPVDQWQRQITKQILAALALYPRGLAMVELAEHVGGGEAGNLTRFKVAISTLRRVLEPDVGSGRESRFVRFADERYQLAPDAVGWLDVRAFENGLAAAERLWGEDAQAAATRTAEALALYRGDLLPVAPFADRFEAERAAMRVRAQSAFLRLAAWQKADPAAAERTLAQAFAAMPFEEEVALALMRHHAALDRPERVRQVYWDARKAIKAAWGGTPTEALEAAFKAVAGR